MSKGELDRMMFSPREEELYATSLKNGQVFPEMETVERMESQVLQPTTPLTKGADVEMRVVKGQWGDLFLVPVVSKQADLNGRSEEQLPK